MITGNSSKTFISATLMTGTLSEPDISNKEFLRSYLDYSCWLRIISAKQYLKVLECDKSGEIERLASLAAFYQTAGLIVEDGLSMYIAWSVWAKDKTQSLPNILSRLSLRLAEPATPVSSSYVDDIVQKFLTGTKRVELYARPFLSQVVNVSDNDLPIAFGIPWKKDPSVKLVPKELLPMWNALGFNMRDSLKPLLDSKGTLLATCYNKIKHGPQIVISDPSVAALARGFSKEKIQERNFGKTIRLLAHGGRVQETENETLESIRVSPFLLMDYPNAKRWYFQNMLHSSNALFICGTWIYNSTFQDDKRKFTSTPLEVQVIIREQGVHLGDTYGFKNL